MITHWRKIVIAGFGLLAVFLTGLSGCGTAVSWEEPVDIEALATTWPKYRAPTYIDPSSPLAGVAGNAQSMASKEAMDSNSDPEGSSGSRQSMGRPGFLAERRRARPPVKLRDDWDTAEIVADSLGRIGSAAVPKVVKRLEDSNPAVRIQAAKILAKIGPAAAGAVPELTELLKDSNEAVRKSAAQALGQIGPAAENSVEALLDLIAE